MIDGIALTKFLFWLKKNFKKKKITEISAQNKLESFRKMNPKYKFPSFSTISGSGPNSAIIHYKATSKTNRKLKKGRFISSLTQVANIILVQLMLQEHFLLIINQIYQKYIY